MIGVVLAVALATGTCAPDLEGDPAGVQAVRRELHDLPARADCRQVRARIEATDGGWIVEESGASLKVHDARAAAAWIESRSRLDLAAPLVDLALLDDLPATKSEVVASASSVPEPLLPLDVTARGELAWTDAGQEIGAAAIFGLGLGWWLEPVAIVRGGAANGRIESPGLPPARRWQSEVLAGLRVPWRLGGFEVRPGVGLGVGLDGTSRDRCANCLPMVDDDASRIEAGLRTEAFVDATVALAGGFSLALSISASASPFEDGSPSLPSWLPPDRPDAAHLALPGAPTYRLRTGAGLSWSVP